MSKSFVDRNGNLYIWYDVDGQRGYYEVIPKRKK